MTKLNIIGLKESAQSLEPKELDPAKNGTYEHLGSQGGTEQMAAGLRQRHRHEDRGDRIAPEDGGRGAAARQRHHEPSRRHQREP